MSSHHHGYHSHLPVEEEETVAHDLLSSVHSMTDMVLTAADGDRIPASRYVLGARSTVLQKRLFIENKTSLPYSGIVVRAVVEYCCSNHITKFAQHCWMEPRQAVHLYNCASKLQLKGLQAKTVELVRAVMEKEPSKACDVFDEATVNSTTAISVLALQTIQCFPQESLLMQEESSPGVISLSPSSLETILSNDEMRCEEFTLFQALLVWTNHAPSHKLSKRKSIAKKLVKKCLDLSCIAPSFLVKTVAESGLVDSGQVWNALKETALRTEREHFVRPKLRSDGKRNDFPVLGTSLEGLSCNAASSKKEQHKRPRDVVQPARASTTTAAPYHAIGRKSLDYSDNDSSSLVASELSLCEQLQGEHGREVAIKATKSRRSRDCSLQDAVETMGTQQNNDHVVARDDKSPTVLEGGDKCKSGGAIKGNLVSLAEKLDALCVCGSSGAENIYQ